MFHIDKRQTLATHINNKNIYFKLKLHNLRFFHQSNTSINNIILLYKQLIYPVMTYDIQIWGPIKVSNLNFFNSSNKLTYFYQPKFSDTLATALFRMTLTFIFFLNLHFIHYIIFYSNTNFSYFFVLFFWITLIVV